MITNWIKSKLGITELEQESERLEKKIEELRVHKASHSSVSELRSELNRHTRTDVDMNSHGRSYICISGKWRNKDYVEVIPVDAPEFESVMHYIKEVRAWNKNRRIDAPMRFEGAL